MNKKKILTVVYALLFALGAVFILISKVWGWGDSEVMNLIGETISVFAGAAFLYRIYDNKKR